MLSITNDAEKRLRVMFKGEYDFDKLRVIRGPDDRMRLMVDTHIGYKSPVQEKPDPVEEDYLIDVNDQDIVFRKLN
jgi:hypothetical protein